MHEVLRLDDLNGDHATDMPSNQPNTIFSIPASKTIPQTTADQDRLDPVCHLI